MTWLGILVSGFVWALMVLFVYLSLVSVVLGDDAAPATPDDMHIALLILSIIALMANFAQTCYQDETGRLQQSSTDYSTTRSEGRIRVYNPHTGHPYNVLFTQQGDEEVATITKLDKDDPQLSS